MLSRRASLAVALIAIGAVGFAVAGVANVIRDGYKRAERAVAITRGDPDRGRAALAQHGCAACHAVPGVAMPGGRAAQSLSGIRDRLYIGGVVPNTPDNMVRWIVNPKEFSPRTAMPVTGITERQARDVTAYLYALP